MQPADISGIELSFFVSLAVAGARQCFAPVHTISIRRCQLIRHPSMAGWCSLALVSAVVVFSDGARAESVDGNYFGLSNMHDVSGNGLCKVENSVENGGINPYLCSLVACASVCVCVHGV